MNQNAVTEFNIPGAIDQRYSMIREAGRFVRQALADMNAAEKWIAIGVRLSETKKELARMQGGDRRSEKAKAYDGPTWEKSFKGTAFPFSQRKADMLITVGEFFSSGTVVRLETAITKSSSLPTSWITLYELAVGFKDQRDSFERLQRESKITPDMTRDDAKRLVRATVRGKGDNNPPAEKKEKAEKKRPRGQRADVGPDARKTDRIAAAWEYLAYLKLKLDDLADNADCDLVERTTINMRPKDR